MSHALAIAQPSLPAAPWKLAAAFIALLLAVCALRAQTPADLVIEGVNESDVLALNKNVEVRGTVKKGVLVLGGDVIITGRVEGDVGAIGGNVLRRPGSFIGGDLIVIGGAYHAETIAQENREGRFTFVFAGYEQELRDILLNPLSLLEPHWSPAYFGQRLLAVLFWFITSLLLTAVSPGAVSRAVERLRLTSPRVALIGILGVTVTTVGATLCANYLPTAISAILAAMTLLLLLLAYVFGRVALHAATGRWLQRTLWPNGSRSESFALLFGVSLWTTLLSLPYIWPLLVAGMLITSLGLALTARYRLAWKRPAAA